jgi:hypothetical protein
MTGSASVPLVTPTRHESHTDSDMSRFDDPLRLYSICQTAALCMRSEGTIRNLISAYQLPKKSGWIVRRRHRQRAIVLRAPVVEWLQKVTLLGDVDARRRPPR